MRSLALVVSVSLCGCGDNRPAPPDGGDGDGFETAPHLPMPYVLPHAGEVLAHVGLVTLTFDGDPLRAAEEAFAQTVFDSAWFRAVSAEYGIRDGRALAPGSLGAAPALIGRADLAARVGAIAARAAAPAAGEPTPLYVVYVPATIARAAELAGVSHYHDMLTVGAARVALAVVLDDGGGIASTTTAAARALIDAAANPFAPPFDGYYADPPASDPWSLVRGEIAELCGGEAPILEGGIALPRVYSSRAADAGSAPCAPAARDEAWTNVTADPAQLRAVPRGSDVMFTLTGWSTRPVSDWRLRLTTADRSDLTMAQMQPLLSDDIVNNGTQVTLKLRVPRGVPSGSFGGVVVQSGPTGHPWVVGFLVE